MIGGETVHTTPAAAAEAADPPPTDGVSGTSFREVEVLDPQQHGEGRSRYTTYCVLVRARPPSPGSDPPDPPSAVRRRYSDFQWLFRRMHAELPGAIVPILPHRVAVSAEMRLSEGLVSFRRASCEVWMNRILRHPELSRAPSLRAFLRAGDDVFVVVRETGNVDVGGFDDRFEENIPDEEGGTRSSGRNGGDRFHRIKKFAKKIRVAMADGSNLERSEDERTVEEIDRYIASLDLQVQSLSKRATSLVKTYKDKNATMEGISKTLTATGSLSYLSYPITPVDDSYRWSSLLAKIGNVISDLGLTAMEQHDELSEKFGGPMQDLARDVKSVRMALESRREIQLDVTSHRNKVHKKKGELESIQNTSVPFQQKHVELIAQIKLAEEKEAASRNEFVQTTKRLLREVERFRPVMRDRIKQVVFTWVKVQMEYNSRANAGWGSILTVLDSEEVMGERNQEKRVDPQMVSI